MSGDKNERDEAWGSLVIVFYMLVMVIVSACLAGSYLLWRFAP